MSDVDWELRELCSDGACNGVIGPDGTCKVCGRAAPNWGDERRRGLREEPEEATAGAEDEDLDDDLGDDEDEDANDGSGTESDGEWSDRKLCDDGACVGVIGPDGTCNVCGKQSAA